MPGFVAQWRGGEKDPPPAGAESWEEILGLVSVFNQLGALPFSRIVFADPALGAAREDQVGHHRAFAGVEGAPLLAGAEHLRGTDAGQVFAGPVPVGHAMVAVEDEGCHRAAAKNLRQPGAADVALDSGAQRFFFGAFAVADVDENHAHRRRATVLEQTLAIQPNMNA